MSLRDQLQSDLGSAYTIDRELGGGGMSRVFVAEETAFGRPVVIKLLAPELAAGVNVDRFRREIQVAARLQHPHIVPVISAGESGGLPWYTMPFVEGESLRARLARVGRLSIDDAVTVLRDVAKALAYAHERGIVHRDIKPDNVLLSGDSAAVADFGIAKAIAAAKTANTPNEPTGTALTSVGMSIGTPAYMAPEQAAADPDIDHRADIYSFGVMAYELLAGRPPFADRTPQRLLAAHMTETPAPITSLRPDVPTALADLVMRCLAKDASERPQSATELVTGLGSTSSIEKPHSWNRVLRVAASVIGVFVLVIAVVAALRAAGIGPFKTLFAAGRLKSGDAIVVADFAVSNSADSTLGRAIADGVRADLSQSPDVAVVPESRIAATLASMDRARARMSTDVAREVAVRIGAPAVIDGTLTPVGAGFLVVLRVVDADSGRELASVRKVAASPSELIGVVGALTSDIRGKMGESLKSVRASLPLPQVMTASLPALRSYSAALEASRYGNFPEFDRLMREAVAQDSAFAMANLKLFTEYRNAQVYNWATMADLAQKAVVHGERLSEENRLRAQRNYYSLGPPNIRNADSVRRFEAELLRRFPNASNVNTAANAAYAAGNYAQAESLYRRSAELDTSSAQAPSNLMLLELTLGKRAAAESAFLETRRRTRVGANVSLEMLAQIARGDTVGAEAIARQGYDTTRDNTARSTFARTLRFLTAVRGQIRESKEWAARDAVARAGQGSPAAALEGRIVIASFSAVILQNQVAAVRILDSAVAATLSKLPDLDRPYFLLAHSYARAGRPDRARAYLNELTRQGIEADPMGSLVVGFTRAGIAIAERKWDEALHALEGRHGSGSVVWLWRGMAYDGRGDRDSAIANFERFANSLNIDDRLIGSTDDLYDAGTIRRLGELYEANGDTAKALARYERFVGLWKNADAELQPQVAEIRTRMARLRPPLPREQGRRR